MVVRDVALLRNLSASEFVKLFFCSFFHIVFLFISFSPWFFSCCIPVPVCIFNLLLPYCHTVVPADSSVVVICTSSMESREPECLY